MANDQSESSKVAAAGTNPPQNASEIEVGGVGAEAIATTTVTTTPTQTTQATQVTQNAIAAADELNASLLQSDKEHTLSTLQRNHDVLNETCTKQQNQISQLQTKINDLQNTLNEKCDLLNREQQKVGDAKKKMDNAQEMEKDANERMARFEVESDSLRQEISRLTTSNASLNTQLTELTAKANLSTSSTTPLQYEVTRLKSELEALNSHSKWLEGELSARTNQTSSLKSTHAKQIQNLNHKLHEAQSKQEEKESDLSLVKMRMNSLQSRMDNVQKELLNKEKTHAEIVHELKIEIQSERNLVALKKENMNRVEERYNDALREIDSMKALAAAADKDHGEEIKMIKSSIEEQIQTAIQKNESENEKRIESVQKQMEQVIVEKTKLEDMLMGLSGGSGTHALAITNDGFSSGHLPLLENKENERSSQNNEPLTLTNLYDKLSDKEQELRHEKAERRKVELYLERIQQDFERIAPKQRQQRREYEMAMGQMNTMQTRIQDALQEKQLALDELHEKERESRQTSLECQELRLENKDLAIQVQQLLKKSMGGEDQDLAIEIQNQNQQLLKEHHRFDAKVKELEEKLESDSTQTQLSDALSALKKMEEEREQQASLVSNIVQQRDLYRALLAKNDAQILAAIGGEGGEGSTAIVAAKDQIEKYTEVESHNKELRETISKLNADLVSATNTKQGLEERLKRMDAYAADLSQNNNKLQNDLLAAHAATARSNAETSFQSQKVKRLEETVEMTNAEISSLNDSKKELQHLNSEMQSILAENESNQAELQENLRQAEVKIRQSETKVQALESAERRLNSDNSALRSELSRHVTLQDTMRRIESGISARSKEDRENLDKEVERLRNEIATMKKEHDLETEKLQNQLSCADLKMEQMSKTKEDAVKESMKAKNDTIVAQSELKQLDEKCATLEKSLNAAKIKLGDTDADFSDQDKIQSMTSEIERLKEELAAANDKVTNYQKISKDSEMTLLDSTKASEAYKKQTTEQMDKLGKDLDAARDDVRKRQEALEGLTTDLSKTRGEQEKALEGLKTEIETLRAELTASKKDQQTWKSQVDELSSEIMVHQADVKASKDNYERELALHAEARKELQQARETATKHSTLLENAQIQIRSMKEEASNKDKTFEDVKIRLEKALVDSEKKLGEIMEQNRILHNQIATMGDKVDSIQMDKTAQEKTSESNNEDSSETIALKKQLKDLQEVVTYMRSEREISETQLQSARLAAERERASSDVIKKALEEARSELDILQKNLSSESQEKASNWQVKLKENENQLTLLRESNKLLREECGKVNDKIKLLQVELNNAKDAVKPSDQKCRDLEIEKAALQAEKVSMMKEVDVWKDRVTSLVSQFHQIDPEEHSKALADAEKNKRECEKIKAAKDISDRQVASAKTTIIKLSKDITKYKSQIESNKTTLEKTKKEIETIKAKNASASEKEIKVLKEANKAATLELQTTNKRVENLSNILKKHKKNYVDLNSKLVEATAKEKETRATLAKEKELHQKLVKAHESLKNSMKEKKDQSSEKQKKIVEEPEGKKEVAKPQQSQSEQTAAETNPFPPIPQVPSEGFKFAPSNSQISNDNKDNIQEKKVVEKQPKTVGKLSSSEAQLKAKDSIKLVKSTATSQKLVSQSTAPSEQGTSKDSKAVISKKDTKTSTKIAIPLKPVLALTKDGVQSTAKLANESNTASQNKLSAVPAGSQGKEENKAVMLREKLMKRKRELAKKLEAKNIVKKAAITSTSDTPVSVPTKAQTTSSEEKDTKENLKESVQIDKGSTEAIALETKTETETEKSAPQNIAAPDKPAADESKSDKSSSTERIVAENANTTGKAPGDADNKKSQESTSTSGLSSDNVQQKIVKKLENKDSKGEVKESKSQAQPAPNPFATFGSGKPITFSSFGGLNASAKPFAPSFSAKATDASKESTTGSAFLNLRPPGSGQSAPLIFGASNSIQLPTPSKPSNVTQSAMFGGNPFASTPTFGGTFSQPSKKRSLESDERASHDESAKKQTRVESETKEEQTSSKMEGDQQKEQEGGA